MARASCHVAYLLVLLVGATLSDAQTREHRPGKLDLLRALAAKSWLDLMPHHRWDRPTLIDHDLIPPGLDPAPSYPDETRVSTHLQYPDDARIQKLQGSNDRATYDDIISRAGSGKRSAVATALNAGRRRRQPTPALGKAVTPYVGVGVLNDMGTFFDSLRDNLETYASLSPHERTTLFQEPPNVVFAPSSGGGGGGSGSGSGVRKLHALRPLRPTGNIRSYNRRSFVEAEGVYPGANNHDPGLLWTGLGR